jgi:hypothetical protein
MHDQETPPRLIGTPVSTMPPSSPQCRKNSSAGAQRPEPPGPKSIGGQKRDHLYITEAAAGSVLVADIGVLDP